MRLLIITGIFALGLCLPGLAADEALFNPGDSFPDSRELYKVAHDCPELLQSLFCYCGCDQILGNRTLFDSFKSEEAYFEPICQDEALEAYQLYKSGIPIGEIQKRIDRKFSRMYPFLDPSAALAEYWRKRDAAAKQRIKQSSPKTKQRPTPAPGADSKIH